VQAWVQQDRLSFGVGLWLPHAAAAALIVLLFVRRVYLQRWLPRWASLARPRRGLAS
jgi:lipopolysaccharide export system permease protein